jgi:hypothetical protein
MDQPSGASEQARMFAPRRKTADDETGGVERELIATLPTGWFERKKRPRHNARTRGSSYKHARASPQKLRDSAIRGKTTLSIKPAIQIGCRSGEPRPPAGFSFRSSPFSRVRLEANSLRPPYILPVARRMHANRMELDLMKSLLWCAIVLGAGMVAAGLCAAVSKPARHRRRPF